MGKYELSEEENKIYRQKTIYDALSGGGGIMKYIIKNCPALCFPLKDNPECECNESVFNNACKDISDCLLKQIVEKCRKNQEIVYETNFGVLTAYKKGSISDEILKMLEIEECE